MIPVRDVGHRKSASWMCFTPGLRAASSFPAAQDLGVVALLEAAIRGG
jgi:hypothetical protein